MLESLNSLLHVDTPPKFFVVIALIAGVVGVVAIIAVLISRLASHRAELEFKRDLVERGLSIDEIERVVSAKPMSKSALTRRQPTEVGASVARG